MKRRDFIKTVGGGIAATAGLAAAAGADPETAVRPTAPRARGSRGRRPNILWIQTDEHRPDALGCYGSSWAKTPNLDALARRGVVMRTCVCQSPVCVPSRSSQLTGLYPQECNTLLNENAAIPHVFPAGTVTFPEFFADHGYQTATIGKWHTPKHPTWSQYLDAGHTKILNLDCAEYCSMGPAYDEARYHVVKRPGIHRIIIGGTYPIFEGNPSRRHTDTAIEFLRTRDRDKPFLLRVSHNWPHTPVLPPPPFDRLYRWDDIPIQYYDDRARRERARFDRTLAHGERMDELTLEEYRQQWKDYMGLVGYVDYEVGRLLAALKALGLEEDTIVLFSADHGRALGEFGHGEKCSFDDQVWRVPFVWHWPGHLPEGETREDLCELIDTGRTLAGLAGLHDDAPATWRGRDLFGAPVPPSDSQAVFGQIGWPNLQAPMLQQPQFVAERTRVEKVVGLPFTEWNESFLLMRMAVRTRRYRMDVTWMQDGRRFPLEEADGNLFDLQTDPQEKDNLWNDADRDPVRRDLMARLERWFDGMAKPKAVFG